MAGGESDFASEHQSSEVTAAKFKIATRLCKLRFIECCPLRLYRSNWPLFLSRRNHTIGPGMFDSIDRSVPSADVFPSGCDTKAARPYICYGHGTRNAKSASYGSRKAYPGLGSHLPGSGAARLQLLPLSTGSGARR